MSSDTNSRVSREREFHDRWAADIVVDGINVDAYFEGSTAPENRFILSHLGPLKGARLLDLGCGAGENTVYFARRGAECVAGDVSPGMVERAIELCGRYGVRAEGKVINALALDFPDESFDVVYAANLLHHVDPYTTLREMRRVLKPGGKACFWDPLRHNPVINVYRRMATEVRTEDETPLDISIVKFVESQFSSVVYDTFWLASLWLFLRFYLIERVHPNKERYWKKIIVEEPRLRNEYLRLERIDRAMKSIDFMKRYAWNIAVVATR